MVDRFLHAQMRPLPRIAGSLLGGHLTAATGPDEYAAWLSTAPADMGASLYLHVPWLHAPWAGDPGGATGALPHAAFSALLAREMALVGAWLGRRQAVTAIHWGGGTATILTGLEFCTLMAELYCRFTIAKRAEIGIKLDPRSLTPETLAACRTGGINCASLAVHDLDQAVQAATGRTLSFAAVEQALLGLRGIGVTSITVDLLAGLPRQSPGTLCRTIDQAVSLSPDRISLRVAADGGASRGKGRSDDAARARLAQAAAERLQAHGYVWIGLDHFARPEDPLTLAARQGRLRRTVTGYTADASELRLGLGPSAIGALPQGDVQNAGEPEAWAAAIARGRLATARGIAIDDDDRLRRAVVERLMCDLAVDLGAVARAYGAALSTFAAEKATLQRLAADGLVELDGDVVRLTPRGRPQMRSIVAVFDRRLAVST